MMSNQDNKNYINLHRTALERSIENCESEEDIAVHRDNLNRHITLEEVEEMKDIKSSDDFLRGQKDCQEGIPAKREQSTDYQRGYAAQYQHDANMDAMTDGH